MYIIAAILIFGVLIAVHELGHFLAAKACGVRVNEFSIGMGPAIFHTTKGETEYSLRLLPIGGFCAMEGEDEESDDPRALERQGFWKKLLIFVAGAAMIKLRQMQRRLDAVTRLAPDLSAGDSSLVFFMVCSGTFSVSTAWDIFIADKASIPRT